MAGYIGGKVPVVTSGTERKQHYNITTTTTSLTGLQYTPTKVHVFHNGVRLVDGTDYTATTGTSITLTNAAQNGDDVVVISYASFQTSDTVSAANGGTFAGNVTMSGDLTVGGAFTSQGIDDNATSTAMTLDASGNVRVGFDSSLSYPSDARLMVSNGGTNGMEFSNTAISGQNRILNYNRTTSAYVPMTTVGSELKFDIGTSEAMRIDSSGRVTMPYQPAFVANTAPATLANNATIVFSSTALNRGSVYNTSNGRFTAPVAGLYQFFASVRIENSSPTAAYHRVSFLHNGTGVSSSKSRLSSRTTTGYYTHAASDQLIGCQAGDYIEVQFESSVGSFTTSAPLEHVFYGYLIG